MQTIALQQVRLVPAWRPAPLVPAAPRPQLAQQQQAVNATPPPPAFIDSAPVRLAFDVAAVAATYTMARFAAPHKVVTDEGREAIVGSQRWSTIFWVLAGAFTLKGLVDLSHIKQA
jgi:hypothetical protein